MTVRDRLGRPHAAAALQRKRRRSQRDAPNNMRCGTERGYRACIQSAPHLRRHTRSPPLPTRGRYPSAFDRNLQSPEISIIVARRHHRAQFNGTSQSRADRSGERSRCGMVMKGAFEHTAPSPDETRKLVPQPPFDRIVNESGEPRAGSLTRLRPRAPAQDRNELRVRTPPSAQQHVVRRLDRPALVRRSKKKRSLWCRSEPPSDIERRNCAFDPAAQPASGYEVEQKVRAAQQQRTASDGRSWSSIREQCDGIYRLYHSSGSIRRQGARVFRIDKPPPSFPTPGAWDNAVITIPER
ncbi:hypothetical protein BU26DRAFT_507814 [Trematosphaeria pertusa]|uniref:Uncharacterized protein n=1 Tax=Trematosphaeria pertusa TaxID=390896 RepID=A0A6A6I7Y9_9PLEO|nr:uncharacterized protein BU26DRAFT_507814 [Trematosphaeria pertusa]KAF2246198.1 hypothetical protein BU26DRAFT_507814 [Trematosphaeria pertusa]